MYARSANFEPIFRMGFSNILRLILLTMVICVLLSHRQQTVKATPAIASENNHVARNNRVRFNPRVAAQYIRTRQEPDFMDEEELFDLTKRQSDDYGHMRFGKREFDDYGHMRFGRSD